jgi:hypothetical protein
MSELVIWLVYVATYTILTNYCRANNDKSHIKKSPSKAVVGCGLSVVGFPILNLSLLTPDSPDSYRDRDHFSLCQRQFCQHNILPPRHLAPKFILSEVEGLKMSPGHFFNACLPQAGSVRVYIPKVCRTRLGKPMIRNFNTVFKLYTKFVLSLFLKISITLFPSTSE